MTDNKNNLLPEFKLIECRQQANASKSFVTRGCDFETILPDGLELKNGESLSVASCFLDTIANDSGLIQLPNNDPANPDNCIISASFFYYLADIPTTNEGRYRGDHDEPPPQGGNAGALLPPIVASKTYLPARNLDDFDGELYIACSKTQKDPATPAVKIDGFRVIFTNDFIRNTEKSQYWFILQLTFTDFDGVTQHQQIYQMNRPAKGKDTASNDIILSLLQEGNILEINNDFIQEYNRQCIEKGIDNQFVQRRVFGINSLNRPNDPARPDDISVIDSLSAIGFSGITNINNCVQTSPFTGSNDHLRPIVGTISMNLPVTTYGADELSQLIGREFSKANQENTNMKHAKDNICANALLKSSRQMRQELHDSGKPIDEVHFVRASDGNQTFQLNTLRVLNGGESASQLANYYIGSSQFGLIYDDTTSKMSIDLMHTSFLDVSQRDGGGLPETRIYKNSTDDEFIATTYSGVVLNDLQPPELWKDSFKFDLNKLLVGYREVEKVYQADPDVHTIAPVFDNFSGQDNRLIAGRNITTELGSIDGCVVKKRTGASGGDPTGNPATPQTSVNTACFDIVPPAPSNQFFIDYFASIQQEHIGIFGKGQVINNSYGGDGSSEGLGYYQIEVDINGVSTDIKGKDRYNNKIMSVISKYYSSTNYLSSYDEGSTEFFYKGNTPLKISKVHVRVLDPDGTLATINNDNTIFLKLQKTK
jgi:hypothetical protein